MQINRVAIEIADACGNFLQVHLCDAHLHKFRTFLKNFIGGMAIFAIQCCKIQDIYGVTFATTFMYPIRIFLNDEIISFNDLNLHSQQFVMEPMVVNGNPSYISSQHSDEPFANIQLTSISELFLTSEYTVHFILATMMKFNTSLGWYYNSCIFYMEELDYENDMYYCYNCSRSLIAPNIRFKIVVDVIDNSGCAR
ncbi:replication factor A protein 1-like [Senna tora]|uniref:Replication factor A protein 1-like n=1 Tax=Senna tora TaxID=362788 RepID=A0A834XHJ4_9FABA|nr:replication factor A protein 1-like [Senna tora]